MINLSKKQINDLLNGEKSSKDIAIELVEKHSSIEIAIAYVEEVKARVDSLPPVKPAPKITLTKEQFEEHFRFRKPRKNGE